MNRRGTLAVVGLFVLAGCVQGVPQFDGETTTAANPTQETIPAAFLVDDEPHHVTLEVAETPEQRARGLMYRQSLQRDHGMLFVFGDEENRTFWMKNTYVPLDMIFVDANGTVITIRHAAPQPNASTVELERYHSDGPAKYVIEMRRGFTNRTGVQPGTEVAFNSSELSASA